MPVINYKRTKTEVPARNFDTKTLTDDYDIALQDASGVYGIKSFFGGIRDFFKGISALGTLSATSRITVTDSNGNVTYTTPNAIKSALSLATTTDLSNYTRIKSIEVADTTVDSLKESLLSNIANFNNGEDILVIRGTQKRGVLKINKQSNIYFSVVLTSYFYSIEELRYNNGEWQENYTLNTVLSGYQPLVTGRLNGGEQIDTGIFLNKPLSSANDYKFRKSHMILLSAVNGLGDTVSSQLIMLSIGRNGNAITTTIVSEKSYASSITILNNAQFLPSREETESNDDNTLIIKNNNSVSAYQFEYRFL